ncbi:MAG: hypothetical protein ABIQ09_00635 [Jatrophihabitantaceae bacterium]
MASAVESVIPRSSAVNVAYGQACAVCEWDSTLAASAQGVRPPIT